MARSLTTFIAFALLTGCAGLKGPGSRTQEEKYIDLPSRGQSSPQTFALPGVPLEYMPRASTLPAAHDEPQAAAKPAEVKPDDTSWQLPPPSVTAAKPAPPPAEPVPAAAAPAQGSEKDLEFHLGAAKRYAAQKKYRSAAAEYGAALLFLPPADGRAVYLQERQGAMLLRAGDYPKAAGILSAAVKKAKDLDVSGEDLANAHLGLAYCLEKNKDIPGAITNYQKTLEISKVKMIRDRVAKTIAELKAAGK